MKSNIDYCAIKAVGRNGDIYFKYPKLSELYHKIFGIIPKGTHNSMVDVLICLRCYCKKIEGSDPVKDANNNLRNILYDLLIYNLNIYKCIEYILITILLKKQLKRINYE